MSDPVFPVVLCGLLAGLCLIFVRIAHGHAAKAATALEDTKAAIAAWWKRVEEGR